MLFDPRSLRLSKGMVMNLAVDGHTRILDEVIDIVNFKGTDGKLYAQPVFSSPRSLDKPASRADITVTASGPTARVVAFQQRDCRAMLDGLYPQLSAASRLR